ncbi:MAG: LytTR family transcriptional regulator DNA-binding domain-containing protein [Bacteroidota bacterium]
MEPLKLLVVEDDTIIGADIASQLTSQGYHVLGIMSKGEDVISYVSANSCPDLVLMDVRLKGQLADGIEVAHQLNLEYNIPIVYLTANIDDSTYNRAKMTNPYAFIAKPFSQLELSRTIELVSNKIVEQKNKHQTKEDESTSDVGNDCYLLKDCIFIKEKEKLIKIKLSDIVYLEADRNYSRFFTTSHTYVFSMPLKALEKRINAKQFVRTHRSFVVNLDHLEEVLEDFVVLAGKNVPLSKAFRSEVLRSIKLV